MIDGTMLEPGHRTGLKRKVISEFHTSAEAGAQYRKATLEAHSRGVFGVSTNAVDNELWWGNDRLDFVSGYLDSKV